MEGKYRNYLTYSLAWLARERLRRRLSNVVEWVPLRPDGPGCTVVIGMCSRLPYLLTANLRCLAASRWPGLRALVIGVDATALPDGERIESAARQLFPDISVKFVYYSKQQAAIAERLSLPYVYSWLSWCIAFREVCTEQILIHDYDALVLGKTLEQRHDEFMRSGAKVQGIAWYAVNGVVPEDRLATTFEQFCDAGWLRSVRPIELFNKLRTKDDRGIDYDTTLDFQDRMSSPEERRIMPMNTDELIHPSQAIHQYTMFRRHPARPLPCFSMPMVPFFSFLGGDEMAILRATSALGRMGYSDVDLLGDGTRVNFEQLDREQVDWALKQMVQALLRLSMAPDPAVHRYGTALYATARVAEASHWVGDFTPAQRAWIVAASPATPGAEPGEQSTPPGRGSTSIRPPQRARPGAGA